MQNYSVYGNAVRLGGNPKYYFNYRHFGHYSDIIRQGRDSKFVSPVILDAQSGGSATGEISVAAGINSIVVPTQFSSVGFNLPAIRVRFVEQQLSEDLNLKEFVQIKPSDVDGTSYRAFQSSNISPYATSSLPFFDNETAINRTYDFIEVLEVTL